MSVAVRWRTGLARLSLMGLALMASLLLAEGIVRVVAPQPLSGSWRVATPSGLLVNKSSGTARHQGGGRTVRYRFHEPHVRDTPWVPSARRILLLGDSFAFGWLLHKEETMAWHLQQHADAAVGKGQLHFLNAAAGGWGTAHCLAFLQEIGDRIQPHAVVVILNTDDIGRSIRSGLYARKDGDPPHLIRQAVGRSRKKELLNEWPGYQYLLEHSHLLQLVRRYEVARRPSGRSGGRTSAPSADPSVPDIPIPSSQDMDVAGTEAQRWGRALFREIQRWCAERNVALYVATTGRHGAMPSTRNEEPTHAFMRQASAIFAETGIPFQDISPDFLAIPEPDRAAHSIPGDGHPSPLGSRFIAERIWTTLLKDRLLADGI